MPRRDGYENATAYAISLSLIFTLFVGALRLWIRKGAYGRDDLVIGAATLVALGHTAAIYASFSGGLGKPWAEIKAQGDLTKLNNGTVAGIVSFLLALYLSKCAMLAFLTRITKTPSHIIFYRICNAGIGALGFISILTTLVDCAADSEYYWAFSLNSNSCRHQGKDYRWQAITALDVFSEIILLVLPVHLVWQLQMPLSKKSMVIAAFWIRLPALGFSIGRNHYTMQLQLPKSDVGLDSSLVTIWLEIELAYAIGASTLSALRSFTQNINTGFGLGFTRGKAEEGYGMSYTTNSTGQSTKTEKTKFISRAHSDFSRSANAIPDSKNGPQVRGTPHMCSSSGEFSLMLRPETAIASFTSVRAEPSKESTPKCANSSQDSNSSNEMVIRRETVYEVHKEVTPFLTNPTRTPR